jgi:hypothetical protein
MPKLRAVEALLSGTLVTKAFVLVTTAKTKTTERIMVEIAAVVEARKLTMTT